MSEKAWLALASDLVCVVLVVTLGFLSHGEQPFNARWLLTVAAFAVAWVWVAMPAGLITLDGRRPWSREMARVAWAWSVAAPLAAVERGWVLGRAVLVTFVLVMGVGLILTCGAWRSLLWYQGRRAALAS